MYDVIAKKGKIARGAAILTSVTVLICKSQNKSNVLIERGPRS